MFNDYVELSKLLHPERLPEEELIKILESRCIKTRNMGGMTREQLLDLFRRVATPLEQRTIHRTGVQTSSNIQNIKVNKNSSNGVIENSKHVTEYETRAEVTVKRECDDQTSEGVSPIKKIRQKIGWP